MDHFNYSNHGLFAEDVAIEDIAKQVGTPTYVYSKATFERHWHAFNNAFFNMPHLICYAAKANSNLAILQLLAKLGSGFDIVSSGELIRVLSAGGDPKKIVFSGVGKSHDEIRLALQKGILCFNVESAPELHRIEQISQQERKIASISIRVNPDVDAQTHPYISTGLKENKFGVPISDARELYKYAAQSDWLNPTGIDCHIGSQLTTMEPLLDALDIILDEVIQLREQGIQIKHLDLGGGLGVKYKDENPPHPDTYAKAVAERFSVRALPEDLTLILEPGRSIAANAGILLTKVEYVKPTQDKNFLVVDAAMNDLLRPSLYSAWQEIIPIKQPSKDGSTSPLLYDVVGPVCETGDFIGKDRRLDVQEGDLLAVRSSGAYGFSMSSNYNSRGRPAEVLVDGNHFYIIRQRETIENQIALEALLSN